MSKAAAEAERHGFPAFMFGEERSNPFNATPYLVGATELETGAFLAHRSELVKRLLEAVRSLPALGIDARALLIGGSVLDLDSDPRDIDCVVFYSAMEDFQRSRIGDWQQAQLEAGLDLRLIPMDSDPIVLMKCVLFFGALYARRKDTVDQSRGLCLVDCAR